MKVNYLRKFILLSSVFLSLSAIFISCTDETPALDDPKTTGWAVGDKCDGLGTILRTINKGLNWETQSTYQAEGVNLFGVSAVSVNEAWVCGGRKNGYGTILVTRDGGASWMRSGDQDFIPNADLKCIVAVNSNEIWAAGDSSTILKTIDGGTTWVRLLLPFIPLTNFTALTVYGNNAWAVGSCMDSLGITRGVIVHSIDGGLLWQRQAEGQVIPYHLSDIQCLSESMVYAAGWQQVIVSSDSGKTWTPRAIVANTELKDLYVMNEENFWFTSAGNVIYHLGQEMDTIRIQFTNSQIYGITGQSEKQVWACGSYGSGTTESLLLFTNTNGQTWFFGENKCKAVINRMSFVPVVLTE